MSIKSYVQAGGCVIPVMIESELEKLASKFELRQTLGEKYKYPIEGYFCERVGYILKELGIPLSSSISIENYNSKTNSFSVDVIIDGKKEFSIDNICSYHNNSRFKIDNFGLIKPRTLKFEIKEGKYAGIYEMPVYSSKFTRRIKEIHSTIYCQNYLSTEELTENAVFSTKIPNTEYELIIEAKELKIDKETLNTTGLEEIISILNSITLQPNVQKKHSLLDLCTILKENTPIFDAKFVTFELRNTTNEKNICKLNVERGNLKDFKLDLFSPNNEFIELIPEIKANRTENKINRIYTYKKDIYIDDKEDTLKIGTLTVSRDEKGKVKTEFQPEEEISNEIVDAYISYQFPKDVFASLSVIANYIKQTKDFANLKSHKLGVSTNLNDIIEHLGKDEYGVCIIDGEQLIYASPLDQTLEVNEHNQLVEKILKEAYPYCNPKEKKSKCIIVEFYKGSYDVRNNDISLILPNRFEIGNRQIAGLLIFLEQIKYATYLGTRTISCNKLNNVKYSVKDMCDFIQKLSTQGYDYREYIPNNPLGIPLDNLFKVCHEPYLIKLLKPTD